MHSYGKKSRQKSPYCQFKVDNKMNKFFNIEGNCYPGQHYMVDTSQQISEIKKLVDNGKYFTINKARQFGKTTTLNLLENILKEQYVPFLISFEGLAQESYASQNSFCQTLAGLLADAIEFDHVEGIAESIKNEIGQMSCPDSQDLTLRTLSNMITRMCMTASRPVVLMIDEVDQASGQEIFLTFLGILRNKYQARTKRATFHSVILASVHDIKNLKLKISKDGTANYNSPWNIAAEFTVDMRLTETGIRQMLNAYACDHHQTFDAASLARWIFDYTSGYPYLVSYLCKKMDEGISGSPVLNGGASAWSRESFLEAVKHLVRGPNTGLMLLLTITENNIS